MTEFTLNMPRLGETMESGTIVEWVVQVGNSFKRGDILLEVETDKTAVEFPALGDGMLVETLAHSGDIIDIDAPIAMLDVTSTGDWVSDSIVQESASEPPSVAPTLPVRQTKPADKNAPIRATPPARLLARQTNTPLETVFGTGRRGRIELGDVMAAQGDEPASFLLIHGFAGDATTWVQLSTIMERAGHSVFTPDLPAHGNNTTSVTEPMQLVEAMRGFAKTCPAPLHVVGHSLGAWVAAKIAGVPDLDIASLTLIAPFGMGSQVNTDFITGMATIQNAKQLRENLHLLGPKGSTLSDGILNQMAQRLATGGLRELAKNLAGPSGQLIDIHSPLAALPGHIPLRAVIGTKDQIIPATQALNLPARMGVHFVDTEHVPHWDAPATVAELIIGNATTHKPIRR